MKEWRRRRLVVSHQRATNCVLRADRELRNHKAQSFSFITDAWARELHLQLAGDSFRGYLAKAATANSLCKRKFQCARRLSKTRDANTEWKMRTALGSGMIT